MARTAIATCDNGCGTEHDLHEPPPKTWWTLSQESDLQTTGTLDFCSLRCLRAWLATTMVVTAYPLDFREKE